MPDGHVMLFLIGLIGSCCFCWRQVWAKDSIANAPLRRLKRTMPTTKRTVSTTNKIVAMNMRKRSSRSANRNFNRIDQMNYKIFRWDVLTSCRTLTAASLWFSALGRFSCLLNHCLQLDKLWGVIEVCMKNILKIWSYLLINCCLSLSRALSSVSMLEFVNNKGWLSFAILFFCQNAIKDRIIPIIV